MQWCLKITFKRRSKVRFFQFARPPTSKIWRSELLSVFSSRLIQDNRPPSLKDVLYVTEIYNYKPSVCSTYYSISYTCNYLSFLQDELLAARPLGHQLNKVSDLSLSQPYIGQLTIKPQKMFYTFYKPNVCSLCYNISCICLYLSLLQDHFLAAKLLGCQAVNFEPPGIRCT